MRGEEKLIKLRIIIRTIAEILLRLCQRIVNGGKKSR